MDAWKVIFLCLTVLLTMYLTCHRVWIVNSLRGKNITFLSLVESWDLSQSGTSPFWVILEDVSGLQKLSSGQNYRSPPPWLCYQASVSKSKSLTESVPRETRGLTGRQKHRYISWTAFSMRSQQPVPLGTRRTFCNKGLFRGMWHSSKTGFSQSQAKKNLLSVKRLYTHKIVRNLKPL